MSAVSAYESLQAVAGVFQCSQLHKHNLRGTVCVAAGGAESVCVQPPHKSACAPLDPYHTVLELPLCPSAPRQDHAQPRAADRGLPARTAL
jgi:hypothetical protein